MSSKQPLIVLSGVSVRIFERSLATTLKQRLLRRDISGPAPQVTILEGIDLRVTPGDRLGILGLNGSGKTSLLKAIAGIYPIAEGRRTVVGELAPVIAQAIGFDAELTLRDNVRLGLIYANRYGTWSPELEARILDFAELSARADQPLKLLSGGFQSRLAFSLSLFETPDILLLDEILATGDFTFFEKARSAMLERMRETPITLFVSHDEAQIRQICNRCIVLSRGRLIADGTPNEVLPEYHRLAMEGQ